MLHLLGRFNQPYTGAERELLDIRRLLGSGADVKVWSDVPPHPFYAGMDIATVNAAAGGGDARYPDGGTLLMGGVHLQPAAWMRTARFQRVILFYNLASHGSLFMMVEALRELTGLEPELVFVSHLLQASVTLPGRVVRSLMDIAPFLQVADARFRSTEGEGADAASTRPFTIGRMSRDDPAKHHPEDPALYRMLASRGVRVRIMGGTCLSAALEGVEGVELLATGAESPAEFCASLDGFFYRTGSFSEAYGRVVPEAMATGLAVVVYRRGGYAELVTEGVSGFLIDSQESAYDALMWMQGNPQARRQMGQAARDRAVAEHGVEATQRDLAYYRRAAGDAVS